ncbi:signal peptidase I [Geofilum sp. OHC36d9]|uniref:signal peptidase I n=1 Tax=Geofilum sp. OHC36d9 TaxID=3458413 RepID=UPI004034030D
MKSNTPHLNKESYLQWLASLLKDGQSAKVRIRGLSMLPWLIPGDGITVQPLNKNRLRVGQVIVFQGEDNWVAHRLIKINPQNNTYITRGDANLRNDKPLSLHQIKGIVIMVSPKHFFWSNWALGRTGKYLATLQPYTAPLFWLMGRIALVIRRAMKRAIGIISHT